MTIRKLFPEIFAYLDYQTKSIETVSKIIESYKTSPVLDSVRKIEKISKKINESISLPKEFISNLEKLSNAGFIDLASNQEDTGELKLEEKDDEEYKLEIEPIKVTKTIQEYSDIFENIGTDSCKKINDLGELEIVELKKVTDTLKSNLEGKDLPYIINIPEKINSHEAENYQKIIWLNRLMKDFGIFTLGDTIITETGKDIQLVLSDKQKFEYFCIAVDDHFAYWEKKKKEKYEKICFLVKKDTFFYNPETGDGKVHGEKFKRFKEDTLAKKLFDEAYYNKGKRIKKKQVISLLNIEIDKNKVDPAKVLSALGEGKTRRKSTDEIKITNSINEVVKEIRKKTGLSTEEFVNNNGNITLNV